MVLSLTLVFYILLLSLHRRIGLIKYSILTTTLYLISLSFIQTLDTTLPLYFVFMVIPNIRYFIVKNTRELFILLYFLCILAISIINNGIFASASIFLIRAAGLFLFFYLFQGISVSCITAELKSEKEIIKIVKLIIFCEAILMALAMYLSFGDTSKRLMLNYQCTVGCIPTGAMLLMAYFLSVSKRKKQIWIAMLIMLAITAYSGTRGYIVVVGAIFAASIVCFVHDRKKVILSLAAIALILLLWEKIYHIIFTELRFGESTGRRASENLFVLKSLTTSRFYNVLFGHGFGTSITKVPEFESILSSVSDSSYTYYIMHYVSGFHNCWYTIWYSAGTFGFIFIMTLYMSLFLKARSQCKNKKVRLTVYAFLFSYFILMWFRWSATSGIFEFFILAIVMKMANNQMIQS